MHVSWYWIKQRPHFIAEQLNGSFDLAAFFAQSIKLNSQLIKGDYPSFARPLYLLPLQRFQGSKFFSILSDFVNWIQLKNQLVESRFIWVTSPILYSIVSRKVNCSQVVIYDCMDDFLEFPGIKNNPTVYEKVRLLEEDLISRADLIFTSSENLREIISKRYGNSREVMVINNAISSAFLSKKRVNIPIDYNSDDSFVDIMYIGTISSWFDFDIICESLNRFSGIRYILIGPLEITPPHHERIIVLGPKSHEDLPGYMEKSDALIMPFHVTDLIKSVNPVKLYEYVSSGKPVIACYYSEIRSFERFVYFYSNGEQFFHLVQKLIDQQLFVHCESDRLSFLQQSTWEGRVHRIVSLLNEF
jgi:glycosyltransferase involved in cell wall biosynthesis